jgi:DNA-binding transcriptional LysR family regulator
MEIRHLRHFVAAVDHGNLSRAADKVFISQPALTRSIKTLEDLLGAPLLERRPRGVVPTAAGHALYAHAKLILNEAARARAEVKAVTAGSRGELVVGIAAMFADHVIDRVVAQIAGVPPGAGLAAGVGVVVIQGLLEDLLDSLREGRIDLIFTNLGDGGLGGDLRVEPLMEVRAYPYAGVGHPLARRRRVTKEDLLNERWVVVDQAHMRDFLDRWFAADGLPPPSFAVRTNSLNLIRSLLATGGFVGILPEHVVALRARRGEVRALRAPDCPIVRRAGLITRAQARVRPVMAEFMELVREASASAAMRFTHG